MAVLRTSARFLSNIYKTAKRFAHHSRNVRIVELGPRDGLQNESIIVPTDVKIKFINQLSETGLKNIEVTSFVGSKLIPQMSDNMEVFKGINRHVGISYPVFVANMRGLNRALAAGVKEISILAPITNGFSSKYTNSTVEDDLFRVKSLIKTAKDMGSKVRGYVSCVVGCPYDGHVKPSTVTKTVEMLFSLGCYEVSLADTIGVGTKTKVNNLLHDVLRVTTADTLSLHFHDTYGQALANICTALEQDVRVFDASVSGLGGCAFVETTTGNVSTEDLVYMLHGTGMETGIDLNRLVDAGQYISHFLKRDNGSKVGTALYNIF